MYGKRRDAIKLVAGAAGMVTLGALFAAAQDSSQRNPSKATASGDAPPDPVLGAKRAKLILVENQKDIKKNIERLLQLATELKDEVEKTDATTVLSLVMLRKTEEIERLAHQIRDRAKG